VFELELAEDAPEEIETDEQRLQQILKNLLSNAFKFTERGSVTLRVGRGEDDTIAFSVVDTGIGIPSDKLRLIFEAFQQAEGSISRRFGGTGLGLNISREIARLLRGEIQVESVEGEGSTFTLRLPLSIRTATRSVTPLPLPPLPEPAETVDGGGSAARVALPEPLTDDRSELEQGERIAVVMTEDRELARSAVPAAHEADFKCLLAVRGDAGLALVHEFMPDAVILSRELPQVEGSFVLDHLKRHPQTRHIPVLVIAGEEAEREARVAGALGVVAPPAGPEALEAAFSELGAFLDRRTRSVLVVADDVPERKALLDLVGGPDVDVTGVATREEAIAELDERRYDCVVLDLGLADGGGFALLERLKRAKRFRGLPVIVHANARLTPREEARLKRFAQALVLRDARSAERLLHDTSLFLHRPEARLPADKRQMLERLHAADSVFEGKKVLIIDDDVRNVFALTSVFERRGMHVVFAENGKEGIEALKENPDVALVLMDIMMPEMDGYEATRAVREMPEFEHLPIVALTAKAMKGDREKSIGSGASDYITKPVDVDQLLSLMRVWLHR
jgi:CheY-like chemotaxis protein